MDFNFYEEYKNYPAIDLLKIIKRPGEYQPEAVEAAMKILSEREVSQTDIDAADVYLNDIDSKAEAKAEKIKAYKDKATDFFEPILKPGPDVKPAKWLNLLLLLIVLQYLWTFYNSTKTFILFLQCRTCDFDLIVALIIFNLLYIPLVFYLLYKRKRWGWILLFADCLFVVITRLIDTFFFFKYQGFNDGGTTALIFPLIIKSAFAFFLWRNDIAGFFGVNDKIKTQTVIITGIFTLLFLVMIRLIY